MRIDLLDSGKWTWNGFWVRLQARQLGSKDFDAMFWRVLLPLMIPAGVTVYFLDIECSINDWATSITLVWVGPIFIVLGWWLAYLSTASKCSWVWRTWAYMAPVPLGLLFAFLTNGYCAWANALTGPVEPVQISGPVIEKKKGMGTRFSGYNYVVTVRFEDRPVCLNVSKDEYDVVPLGAVYGREMRRGGFGYFYQWKKRSS